MRVRVVSHNVMYTPYYGLLNIVFNKSATILLYSLPVSASFKVIYLDNVQTASILVYSFLSKKKKQKN